VKRGLSPKRQTGMSGSLINRLRPAARPSPAFGEKPWLQDNFRRSYTALVTPFKNGSLDEAAFRGLVSWQIAEGPTALCRRHHGTRARP